MVVVASEEMINEVGADLLTVTVAGDLLQVSLQLKTSA